MTTIPTEILALKDGPEKKFKLMKLYGVALRERGIEGKTMSCAEIVAVIEKLMRGETND
jgi:hypothetical protein